VTAMTQHPLTRPFATGAQGYSETLPCEVESARHARLLISAALNTWGLAELVDAAVLVVSELVSNSAQHTHCRLLRVAVSRPLPGRVRIAVTDKSRTAPTTGKPAADDAAGRGLVLVDAVSGRWGYDLHRWGKTVWAELRTEESGP
jgi:hypothetical protein